MPQESVREVLMTEEMKSMLEEENRSERMSVKREQESSELMNNEMGLKRIKREPERYEVTCNNSFNRNPNKKKNRPRYYDDDNS